MHAGHVTIFVALIIDTFHNVCFCVRYIVATEFPFKKGGKPPSSEAMEKRKARSREWEKAYGAHFRNGTIPEAWKSKKVSMLEIFTNLSVCKKWPLTHVGLWVLMFLLNTFFMPTTVQLPH